MERINAILKKSNDAKHKYVVIVNDGTKKKTLRFGDIKYQDYTTHKDDERKRNYINRHQNREYWNDPYTKGFWSRWLLWNKKTIRESMKDISKTFGINFK